MTVTIIQSRDILAAVTAGYPRDGEDGRQNADTHWGEAMDIFRNKVEANGLVLQGGYEEMKLLLPSYLSFLSTRRHCAAVIEMGAELPVDSLYMIEELRRYTEFSIVTRARGSTMRVYLAFYTREAGRSYDTDLFPSMF